MPRMKASFFDKLPNWLRWLLLPIVVVVSFIIATAAIGVLFWISRAMIGAIDSGWMYWLQYYVLQPGLSIYASVITGVYCAPKYHFNTSLIIGILFIFLNGMSLFILLEEGFQLGVFVALLSGVIGAAIAIKDTKVME